MSHGKFTGPKLPQQLLNQVDPGEDRTGHNRGQRRPARRGRKEQRKALRQEKKAKRQTYRNTRHQDDDGDDSLSENHDEDEIALTEPPLKRPRISPPANSRKEHAGKLAAKSNRMLSESESEEHYSRPPVSTAAKAALDNDDAEIAFLQKKLGLRGKKSGKGLGDGLDELLGGIDDAINPTSEDSADEEDQQWLKKKRKKFDSAARSSGQIQGLGVTTFSETESEDVGEENSEDGLSGDSDESGSDPDDEEFDGFEDDSPQPKRARENPYVPPIEAGSKYVPPSLRPVMYNEE
jgi:nucleolar MIF4G domain-containing protein 1